MGLFSWLVAAGRKNEAVALIQRYFETSKQRGVFPGDPARTANRMTELACNRIPDLAEHYKGYVLAANVLSIAVMEKDLPPDARNHCARALLGMLQAAHAQQHLHSYEDQQMLDVAKHVHARFQEIADPLNPPANSPTCPRASPAPARR